MKPRDLISQIEAATKAKVSRQAINDRIKAGTLRGYPDAFGIIRVSLRQVLGYKPRRAGRPKKAQAV